MDDKGKEFLAGACADARKWAMQFPTLAEAWEACERPDWMLRALNMIGFVDDKTYRLFACWCVRFTPLGDGRVAWDLLTDERSRNAVEVAERFANGEATREELDAAWNAAWNAAWVAAWDAARVAARDAAWDAARVAAWAAAWNAARAAAWAAAENAAWDAARVAAWDAARVAARDAAWDAARDAAWDAAGNAACKAQADQLRKMVANPFL